MSGHQDLGQLALGVLGKICTPEKKDIGADARLAKSGMAFETEVYELPGLGQLCLLRMKAMLGLMKMETAVLAPSARDLPLLNLDWVGAMGKETQIVELYDTQLQPYPDGLLAEFQALQDRDADLPGMTSAGHWYDAILYPCSYHKAGKGLSERLAAAARAYMETYAAQIPAAPLCDPEEKRARVRAFAERLFAEGGPAVDQVTKLFGRETAERLILRHMYGVR